MTKMAKPTIIGDAFEQLGQVVGSVVKQAVKTPAGIADEAAKQVLPVGRKEGLAPEGIEQPASGQAGQSKTAGKLTAEEMNKRIAAAERKRSLLHYRELQEETRELAAKRRRAIWEEVQTKKRQELQKIAIAEEKKKGGFLTLARDRAKTAVERLRGVSG